jgi:hypothetical protein
VPEAGTARADLVEAAQLTLCKSRAPRLPDSANDLLHAKAGRRSLRSPTGRCSERRWCSEHGVRARGVPRRRAWTRRRLRWACCGWPTGDAPRTQAPTWCPVTDANACWEMGRHRSGASWCSTTPRVAGEPPAAGGGASSRWAHRSRTSRAAAVAADAIVPDASFALGRHRRRRAYGRCARAAHAPELGAAGSWAAPTRTA